MRLVSIEVAKATETSAKKSDINSIIASAKKELITALKNMPDRKQRKVYDAWVSFFDYGDSVGKDIPKFDDLKGFPTKLANEIMNSDPYSDLFEFLMEQKLITVPDEQASVEIAKGKAKKKAKGKTKGTGHPLGDDLKAMMIQYSKLMKAGKGDSKEAKDLGEQIGKIKNSLRAPKK